MVAYVQPGTTGPLSQGAFLWLWVGGLLLGALALLLISNGRPGYLGGAGVLAVLAACGFLMPGGRPLDAAGVNDHAWEAASAMSRSDDYWLGHPGPANVRNALDEAAGDGRLKATQNGTDRYTVTNADGDHPVCLTVTPGSPTEDFGYGRPSVSVTDGRC